jgi:hypothetical protein
MRSTLKYGLITGITLSIFATAFFSIVDGLNNSHNWGMQSSSIRGITGLLTILILATGIYVAMQAVKKGQNNTLTYSQAIKTGILVAIITAIITAFGSYIYCEFINPGYAQYMLAEAQKAMAAQRDTPQQIAADSVKVKQTYSTGMQVIQSLVGQSVVGTALSLVLGLFLRTRKQKSVPV